MEIVRCKTKEEARIAAGEVLDMLFIEILEPVLFLSSGGSSLDVLSGLETRENSMVSVLDERYSTDPAVNNFAQLFERMRPSTFIDTRVRQDETLGHLAQRFERELRMWKEKNPSGKVVIIQGVGSDGHTAGIMPYPENRELFRKMFEDTERWVVGYDAKEKSEYPLRVTVTMPFLREIVGHSLVYVTGENKKEALARILDSQGNLWETPGRIIQEMRDVKIFTDIVY